MKPNILFLIIDSFRADKFFQSGKTSQTPNLDKLIEKGVYFQQAITSTPGTLLAWDGIFTSLYSFRTGVSGKTFFKNQSKGKNLLEFFKENKYNLFATVPRVAEYRGQFAYFPLQYFFLH